MYHIILPKVEKLLREFDLQGLISMGAPKNEYNKEALAITMSLNYHDTINDIALKVYNIFYDSFCVSYTIPYMNLILSDVSSTELLIGKVEDYYKIAYAIKNIF